MIVREKHSPFTLLFAWRGTILPKVLPAIVGLVALSMVAWALSHFKIYAVTSVPSVGFAIFGILLSIFLGFRNTACYDRWWEARKLWGALIASTRHLTRDSHVLPSQTRERLLMLMLTFVNLLRDRLRYQTAHPESLAGYGNLPSDDLAHLSHHINAPQVILEKMQLILVKALKDGDISDIIYTTLLTHLNDFGSIQAGCDRIASTPLPFSYSVLLHRSVYCFCWMLPFGIESVLGIWTPFLVGLLAYMFLGLDELSSQLEEPFGTEANDLPLDSMTRLIERETLALLHKPLPNAIIADSYHNLL